MNTYINSRNNINQNKNTNEISYSLENLKNCDKVFLQSIIKRQYFVLKDLYKLHDEYPSLIDVDLVASLDSLFRIMADMSDSIC